MEMTFIFGTIAVLLLLAFVANRLSGLTRVPDVIVLLLIGILLGPVLHWVHADRFRGVVDVMGTLALILILFLGGIEIRLREALHYLPGGLLLAVLGYGLSLAVISVAGKYSLHLSWMDALLIGAALGSTSGSIVLPALQQITTPESIKLTLTLESAIGEILAVLMVGSIIGVGGEQSMLTGLATGFSRSVFVALALAIAAGFLWSKLWPRFANVSYTNVLNLGVVFAVYAASRALGGSGLLAVLAFGVTLANVPRTPHTTRQGLRMLAFHSELTFLVRSFFFVLLGIVAQFVSRRYILPILGILAGMLVARYLAVLASRWAVRDATSKEKELLFWMLPRGLVTAVLAIEIVSERGEVFAFLPAIAFTVVLVSNVFVVWGAIRAGAVAAAKAVPVVAAVDELQAKTAGAGS